jgi:hypothetical protein
MNKSLITTALVFFFGAVFGRIFGVKPLVNGAVAAASFIGFGSSDATPAPVRVRQTRRPAVARASAKKTPRKRSAPLT